MGYSLFLVVSLLAGAHAAQYIDTCSDNDAGPSIHFLMDAADDNNVLENLVQKIEKPSPPHFSRSFTIRSVASRLMDGRLGRRPAPFCTCANATVRPTLSDIMSW